MFNDFLGERNYECAICNKRFLYSYNVTAHIKHVHYHEKRPQTNEEKLTCTVCGKVSVAKRWRRILNLFFFQILEIPKDMEGEAAHGRGA